MNNLKILILLILLLILVSCTPPLSRPIIFSQKYQVGDTYMGIGLRGTIELSHYKINGLKLTELSGLAWDEDEKVLYALSDKGYLFHLRLVIIHNTIKSVIPLFAYLLHNEKGQPLPSTDSEGLAILKGNNGISGDSELIISFEHKPLIAKFTPKGQWLNSYTLPTVLKNIKHYYDSNKVLEAVTVHPRLGILTVPEWPLKVKKTTLFLKEHQHTIYALDSNKQWTFPAYPVPNSAIVALETLTDGSILLLERAFVSIFQPIVISIRQLWLEKKKLSSVAVFDNSKGWSVDNFEGLTHHKGTHFLMVSDDNDHVLQRTLLSYWELK